jgi:two-component system OmpR family sensor kinase
VNAAERRLLSRTRAILSLQLAGAITAVVLLVGSIAYFVTVDRQRSQISATLHFALRQSKTGMVDPCMWVFTTDDGVESGTSLAPLGLPDRVSMRSATEGGDEVMSIVDAGGTTYTTLTVRRGGEIRQAAFDMRYQLSDRRQLAWAMLLALVLGLLIAAGTGWLLAGRAIRPLDDALTRQRRFVADASHELRTPLTRLYTRAQLLLRLRGPEVPKEIELELRQVIESSRELNEIVDDLLRSATLSAHPPQGEPVDIAEVASSVADAEQLRASEAGIVVAAKAEGGQTVVSGVESALRRMISALVDNALRHTAPGGHVWLTTSSTPGLVELVVADDGSGIDPASADRLFERFNHSSPGRPGHGLGLSLVREIVEAHGGSVNANGNPGAGSRFTVRLPLLSPAPATSPGG